MVQIALLVGSRESVVIPMHQCVPSQYDEHESGLVALWWSNRPLVSEMRRVCVAVVYV
jgi:hypothetical protein